MLENNCPPSLFWHSQLRGFRPGFADALKTSTWLAQASCMFFHRVSAQELEKTDRLLCLRCSTLVFFLAVGVVGNSLTGPPVHICNGCCGSEAESLDKAVALVQNVFLRCLTVPALNKWTTVAPCMTLVAAMQQFSDVAPKAFGRCFEQGPQAESSDSRVKKLAFLVIRQKCGESWLERDKEKPLIFSKIKRAPSSPCFGAL